MNLLVREGVRATADLGPDKVGAKVRLAETEKIPWMLVVGERDVEAKTVSPRRHKGRPEPAIPVEEFLARVRAEVAAKKREEAPSPAQRAERGLDRRLAPGARNCYIPGDIVSEVEARTRLPTPCGPKALRPGRMTRAVRRSVRFGAGSSHFDPAPKRFFFCAEGGPRIGRPLGTHDGYQSGGGLSPHRFAPTRPASTNASACRRSASSPMTEPSSEFSAPARRSLSRRRRASTSSRSRPPRVRPCAASWTTGSSSTSRASASARPARSST